jgi:hypothetical protein
MLVLQAVLISYAIFFSQHLRPSAYTPLIVITILRGLAWSRCSHSHIPCKVKTQLRFGHFNASNLLYNLHGSCPQAICHFLDNHDKVRICDRLTCQVPILRRPSVIGILDSTRSNTLISTHGRTKCRKGNEGK